MDTQRAAALRDIEGTLRAYGPQPSRELLSRVTGPLSEEEVWKVIRYAQEAGMIEPAKTLFKAKPLNQRWQLVKGFDRSKLEALTQESA